MSPPLNPPPYHARCGRTWLVDVCTPPRDFPPLPPIPYLPGVMRAHLVDAQLDGGLLLELYSRDGVGTMISADFYEGEMCGV